MDRCCICNDLVGSCDARLLVNPAVPALPVCATCDRMLTQATESPVPEVRAAAREYFAALIRLPGMNRAVCHALTRFLFETPAPVVSPDDGADEGDLAAEYDLDEDDLLDEEQELDAESGLDDGAWG